METEHFTDTEIQLQANNRYFNEKSVDLTAKPDYISNVLLNNANF